MIALPMTPAGLNLLCLAAGESALIASHLSGIATEQPVCVPKYTLLGALPARAQTPTPAFSEQYGSMLGFFLSWLGFRKYIQGKSWEESAAHLCILCHLGIIAS